MSRHPSSRIAQRNQTLLERMRVLKAEHPFWGYRRIWAYLRFVEQLPVNKKRILRLMQEHHLLVTPQQRLKAKRTPMRSKPKPTRPNEWWGIDMTKVMVQDVGWVYIVVVLDWYTKMVVGYHADLRSTARHWLAALDMAVNRQFPHGVRGKGLSLMSDNGCQPTSVAFMQACSTLGIHQTFTSYNNPKGNADTERMMRTLKEECLWLHEWTCPFTLASALETWIEDYNTHYLHSALGYKPPRQFEREYHISHGSQFVAA
jgi:putative transposase